MFALWMCAFVCATKATAVTTTTKLTTKPVKTRNCWLCIWLLMATKMLALCLFQFRKLLLFLILESVIVHVRSQIQHETTWVLRNVHAMDLFSSSHRCLCYAFCFDPLTINTMSVCALDVNTQTKYTRSNWTNQRAVHKHKRKNHFDSPAFGVTLFSSNQMWFTVEAVLTKKQQRIKFCKCKFFCFVSIFFVHWKNSKGFVSVLCSESNAKF